MNAELTSPLTPPHADHLGGVDWLRLLAITAIAYYHAATIWYPAAPAARFAFAGLHALTAAAAYFAAASRSARSDREIVVKRAQRVLIPWLAFSLLHISLALRSGNFRRSMLWVGGSTHLWFLPFIFVVGCAISMLARRGLLTRSLPSFAGWTLAAFATQWGEPIISASLTAMEPVRQIVNALPSALMGVAIFAAPNRRCDLALIGALLATAILLPITLRADSALPLTWPAAAAIGAFVFAVVRLLPIRASAASSFAGRASFGVYLLHMLMLAIVVRLIGKLTHSASEAVASDRYGFVELAQVVACVIACLAIVAVVERTPFRRFIG